MVTVAFVFTDRKSRSPASLPIQKHAPVHSGAEQAPRRPPDNFRVRLRVLDGAKLVTPWVGLATARRPWRLPAASGNHFGGIYAGYMGHTLPTHCPHIAHMVKRGSFDNSMLFLKKTSI